MYDFLELPAIVCERLTITLLHFLWQGAAVGLVAALASRLLLRATAQLRYVIHVAALAVMCACLPITCTLVTVQIPVAETNPLTDQEPPHANINLPQNEQPPPSILFPNPSPAFLAPEGFAKGVEAPNPTPVPTLDPATASGLSISKRAAPKKEAEPPLSRWAPYVTTFYLAGVCLLLARLVRSAWLTRRLGHCATEVDDRDLLQRLRTQAERLGLPALPALRWCQAVPVPVVTGVLRPIVLLPTYAATGLTMDQLQAVISHELAHIRRYDLLVNMLQRVIESLLFFHPAVWWVSQQVSHEREHACDELVLTVEPGRARYADALVRMAELSLQSGSPPCNALAATGPSSSAFKQRVLKVLEIESTPSIRPGRAAAIMASLVVLSTLALFLFKSGVSANDSLNNGTSLSAKQGSADSDNRETEIKVGMTFDEVIRIKGRHYRPQFGMGAGQLFLNYDDLCVGIENHPIGKEGGRVFRIDPINKSIESILGNVPYADAAQDGPMAQPPASDSLPPRVELVGLTWDRSTKNDAWHPSGAPILVPDWAKPLPELAPPHKKVLNGTLFLYEFQGLKTVPSIYYHQQVAYQAGDEQLANGMPWRRAILYTELLSQTFPEWGSPPALSLSDEAWGPWKTVTKDGQLAKFDPEDATYRLGYEQVSLHGVRPLVASIHNQDPLPANAPLAIVQHQPEDFRERWAIEVEGVAMGDGTQPPQYYPLETRFFVRFQNESTAEKPWEYEIDWPFDPKQIDHLRFRIRPYRHRFIFENVNFAPSQNAANYSPFKIVYEKLEHDLPKPNSQSQLALIHDLSHPDQAIRDQAAAQLRSMFKPSAKEPWQQALDAIPIEAPRAEVLAKLGLDEKSAPKISIDSMEQYRLDHTWIANLWFTNDLQKLYKIELVEQLDRPWVNPPADFTGTWLTYYVNGAKAFEIDYRDGKYQGRHRSYHANGQLLVQQHYLAHVAHGEDAGYYPSGKRMYRGLYEDGQQVGSWIHYHEDGREQSRTEHPQPTKLEVASPAPAPSSHDAIELQVVDATTRAPIAGAEVTLRHAISAWQPARSDSPPISTAVPESRVTLQTNDTGHFSFMIPAELRDWQSDLQVSVRHPDYVIEQSFGMWPVSREMAADSKAAKQNLFNAGVIELNRGHEIHGQVLSPDGQPAVGVKLYAASQMPEYLNMPPHAVTNREGKYKFRVPTHERHYLFIIPNDAVAQSLPIRKAYGEHPPIQLEQGATIVGQVLDRTGKPMMGVVVQANGSDSVYDGFTKPMTRVLTDDQGRYSLPPQQLPVDIRVASLGWLGGWNQSGQPLRADEVFLPVLLRESSETLRNDGPPVDNPIAKAVQTNNALPPRSLTLDFQPCETVVLTAMVYDDNGQPATKCELAIFGTAPESLRDSDELRSTWRGHFAAIPDQPGRFSAVAPKGLIHASLVHPEIPTGPLQKCVRKTREDESHLGPHTDASWTVLSNDDDSIMVGEPRVQPPMPSGSNDRVFPTRFADEFIARLKTRTVRALSGPQPFLNPTFLDVLRAHTIAFLTATTKSDPTPESQQAIIDSMIRRVTNPDDPTYQKFGDYLQFGNAYKDLMWRVQAAMARTPGTEPEQQQLAAQAESLRTYIRRADSRDVNRFNDLLNDPLWFGLQSPLGDAEFRKLEDRLQASSVGGLFAVMSGLQVLNTPPLAWPDQIVGSGGPTGNLAHEFQSEQHFQGITEVLGSVEDPQQPGVVHLDQVMLVRFPKQDVPDLAALQKWVLEHGFGDVGYSPTRDELIAFRRGKLLKLDTNDWWVVDQMSDDDLRAKIEQDGTETISLVDYRKQGLRAATSDPALIAIRTGAFDGQGQLFVFAVGATDMGMHVHIRPRPAAKRSLDLLQIPVSMSAPHGRPWHGLRTSMTLAEPTRTSPEFLNRGRVLVNVDLYNGSEYPQTVAFDPTQASNSFDIYSPNGTLVATLVGQMPGDVERDEQGQVIPRVVQPGKSIRLLENFNLGLAYPLVEPGQYQIRFGGQDRALNLGHYGRSYPPSNMLTLDVANGATPLIHNYWRMFVENEDVPKVPHWFSHRPGIADERTLYFRRADYVYTNFVLLTFTDSADPVPDRKWTPGGIQVPNPWPKMRDVLLGQTPLGFAHLLLPPTADEEWPQCEEQVRAILGVHLTPRDANETPKTSATEADGLGLRQPADAFFPQPAVAVAEKTPTSFLPTLNLR